MKSSNLEATYDLPGLPQAWMFHYGVTLMRGPKL